MTTPADVVAEARSWLGTPVVWQGAVKGVGCDCRGLVRGVALVLGLPEANSPWATETGYDVAVPVDRLQRGLGETLASIARAEMTPGDVPLMSFAGRPQHLGIFTGDSVIHAYGRGPRQVIETPWRQALRAWPLVSAWRFASLEREG